MIYFKALLEWWRLIGATIAGLPFFIWANNVGIWLKKLPDQWLSVLVGVLLIGNLISFVYLLKFKLKLSKKHILKFGIYWDADKNAYCPVCQKPVSYNRWADGSGGSSLGYFCTSCTHIYPLSDKYGKELKPEEILSKL